MCLLLVRLVVIEFGDTKTDRRAVSTYHIVHLIRDILQPVLNALHALNHECQFGTDDSLTVERLSESLALGRPPLEKISRVLLEGG